MERVFGVLFKRFGILNIPARLWCSEDLKSVVKACTIIHNMVIKERRGIFVGDGVRGLRVDRIERELNGNIANLETSETRRFVLARNIILSTIYDDINEKNRLVASLIDHLAQFYNY